MKIGVKKTVINPEFPVDLAGFGVPGRKSAGVHDYIYLSVMVAEHDGKKAAFICADIIGFDQKLVKDLKSSIYRRFGFHEDEVFFNASHTHSGPQTLTYMLSLVGKADADYLAFFNQKLYSAFEDALNDLEETEVYAAVTKSDIGINRRLIAEGKALFAPNEDGPADNCVTVIKFSTGDRVKAVLFNYACHPSIVCTNNVSADYPGYAKKTVEEHFGKGTVAFFMQGCCGNIRARTVENGRFRSGTWDDVAGFGSLLGQNVIDACEGNMQKIEDFNILTAISHIDLPLEEIPSRKYYEEVKQQNSPGKKEWAEKMRLNYESLKSSRSFIIHRISIGKKLRLSE
ncbi:MAG TPA: hypothetical protein GXX49_09455 [Clostridiaceae bacterium]|jgi:hypothetical protein|nr:hypothetical protein [Clostridiaceae bacterium]